MRQVPRFRGRALKFGRLSFTRGNSLGSAVVRLRQAESCCPELHTPAHKKTFVCRRGTVYLNIRGITLRVDILGQTTPSRINPASNPYPTCEAHLDPCARAPGTTLPCMYVCTVHVTYIGTYRQGRTHSTLTRTVGQISAPPPSNPHEPHAPTHRQAAVPPAPTGRRPPSPSTTTTPPSTRSSAGRRHPDAAQYNAHAKRMYVCT